MPDPTFPIDLASIAHAFLTWGGYTFGTVVAIALGFWVVNRLRSRLLRFLGFPAPLTAPILISKTPVAGQTPPGGGSPPGGGGIGTTPDLPGTGDGGRGGTGR